MNLEHLIRIIPPIDSSYDQVRSWLPNIDFDPTDIPLTFTHSQLVLFDSSTKQLCEECLFSDRGITTIRRLISSRSHYSDIEWQRRISGILIELFASSILQKRQTRLTPQLILDTFETKQLFERLYSGSRRIFQHLNGADLGINGVSIPDACGLHEEEFCKKKLWVIDTIYECKAHNYNGKIHKQVALFKNPNLLAKNFLVDTTSGQSKVGFEIGRIKNLPPRRTVLQRYGPDIEVLVPQGVLLAASGAIVTEIPIHRTNLTLLTDALWQDLSLTATS